MIAPMQLISAGNALCRHIETILMSRAIVNSKNKTIYLNFPIEETTNRLEVELRR